MISILIVGYNSKSDLANCLGSIFKSSYKNFRVLFLDNSNDGSVKFIKDNFPEVITIPNSKNLGYAGGNNLLFKEAKKLKGDYFLLLNADTIIEKDCLKNLIRKANQNTILQPLLLLYKDGKATDLINTDGNVLNYLGYSYCGNMGSKEQEQKVHEIPLASGAAMFLPASIIDRIGGFDENYFIYHEDADLSLRARIAGYNIKVVPEAKLWHKYSFSKHKSKFYYAERNRLRFLLKNFSLKYLVLIFPAFLINEFLVLFYSILTGWAKEKIKSWIEIIKALPEIRQQRCQINQLRQQKEKQIKRIIIPSLNFKEFSNPLFKIYNVVLNCWWYLIYSFI